jgi:hypothetical protein
MPVLLFRGNRRDSYLIDLTKSLVGAWGAVWASVQAGGTLPSENLLRRWSLRPRFLMAMIVMPARPPVLIRFGRE